MKFKYLIISLIVLVSCKEKPTYNPFDAQTNISVNVLKSDGCEVITVECGYFNYEKNIGTTKVYYQFYMDEPNTIVAKLFDYKIDSVYVEYADKIDVRRKRKDSVLSLPIDTVMFNKSLKPFNCTYLSTEKKYDKNLEMNTWTIFIKNETLKDTIPLYYDVYWEGTDSKHAVREVGYFKPFKNN